MKRRRESDAASVKSALSEVKAEAGKKEGKTAKKTKAEPEPEVEEETENMGPDASDKKKQKKKSKKVKAEDTDVAMTGAEEEVERKPSKKDKKEKKRKRDAEDAHDEHPTPKKEKGEKKSKRSKSKKADEEDAPKTNADAENWNVDELEGGQSRQAKFMRLLGGKKAGASAATDPTSAKKAKKGTSDSIKAEAEIRRQFETGMKAKNEGGAHRRGLGA